MSDPVTKRLHDELAGDVAIAGLISTYRGLPAVFTADPAPEKALFPYIMVRATSLSFQADTLDTDMKVVTRSILCLDEADGNVAMVDDIAIRVEELFKDEHGARFANMDGWYAIMADTGGPVDASPDEKTYGRSVDITLTMEKP